MLLDRSRGRVEIVITVKVEPLAVGVNTPQKKDTAGPVGCCIVSCF